uniref:Uncharacterized protein n=1 Tax=Avena sativa TaxID=4498 RepID=A0ACD5XIW0_AVESA
MKGSNLAHVITILFIGLLTSFGHCHLETRRSYRHDQAMTGFDDSVLSSLDENRLHLKFCVPRDCKTKGEAWKFFYCICCVTLQDIPCYSSLKECQQNCPETR